MVEQGQLIAAFVAGLLSFFAPCVLPLFPTYVSVITGFTFSELYGLDMNQIRSRVFFSSLFFVFGFSLVFTILGMTGAFIGQFLDTYLSPLLRISGAFLLFLGLIQIGVIRFESMRFDYAWNIQRRLKKVGYVTSAVTGIASALSWIPCVGPLLSPILLLAGNSKTVFKGGFLLFVYSMGLTLPFIIGGLYFPKVVKTFRENKRKFHLLSIGAGVVLILFGILLIIGQYRAYIALINHLVEGLKSYLPL